MIKQDKNSIDFGMEQDTLKQSIWRWVSVAGLFGALITGAVTSYQSVKPSKLTPVKQVTPRTQQVKTYE